VDEWEAKSARLQADNDEMNKAKQRTSDDDGLALKLVKRVSAQYS